MGLEFSCSFFEEGVNLMTSIPFSAVSLGCCGGLVVFPIGLGALFLVGRLILHSVAQCPSWPHLNQVVERSCQLDGLSVSLFSGGDFFHGRAGRYLFRAWSISTSSARTYQLWKVKGAHLEMQALHKLSFSPSLKQLMRMSFGQLLSWQARSWNSLVYSATPL